MEHILKKIDNDYISIWLEGNFTNGYYKNVHVDLTAAKQIVKERIEVFGDRELPGIVSISDSTTFSKQARDYLGSKEACIGVKKLAIIASSPVTITLVNFYLKISRPPAPTKLFRNFEDAKKWILKP